MGGNLQTSVHIIQAGVYGKQDGNTKFYDRSRLRLFLFLLFLFGGRRLFLCVEVLDFFFTLYPLFPSQRLFTSFYLLIIHLFIFLSVWLPLMMIFLEMTGKRVDRMHVCTLASQKAEKVEYHQPLVPKSCLVRCSDRQTCTTVSQNKVIMHIGQQTLPIATDGVRDKCQGIIDFGMCSILEICTCDMP